MDISIIITAICNQACRVETNPYSLIADTLHLHLPKCLISTYNYYSPNDAIFIYPLIPQEKSGKYVELRSMLYGKYRLTFFHNNEPEPVTFIYICSQYDLNNTSKFLATFLYADNNYFISTITIYPCVISNCKKFLRNEMVQNLAEIYLVKYMCLTSSVLSIIEIKIIIIETFIKMEKWNNLEIC